MVELLELFELDELAVDELLSLLEELLLSADSLLDFLLLAPPPLSALA